ncbi:MAG: DUF167 domain-containing protein [Candidatus Heimdallarchaeota archaeon]|nr:MAG: DUF167 domain-containing protein [Candidatus Heimdallarchaeota archaeon]
MREESWLKSDETDTLVQVKVKTRQIEDAIVINHENLVVSVTVPPVQGKANKRLIKLLKKKFKTEVILEAGQVSSKKVFRLKNLSPEQILEFLED